MDEPRDVSILVVDDEGDHRALVVSLLKAGSLSINQIVECSDGSEAVAKINGSEFDCILLDYDLPGVSGLEVLRRAVENDPDNAVIMVTARGNEEVAVEAMKSGAVDYLVKGSLSRENLDRAIQSVLQRQELRRTVRRQREELVHAERQRGMLETLGSTCHHFSQPLTSLMGRLDLLLEDDGALTEKQRAFLAECLECTERMAELLKQFHDVREYRTQPYIEGTDILDIEVGEET